MTALRTGGLATVVAVCAALAACTPSSSHAADKTVPGVPADVSAVMHKAGYEHSRWGLAVRDVRTGRVLIDQNSGEFFPPGSTTKLFTGLPTWDALDPDHRFTTPVYATTPVTHGIVSGSLVLVAQGDLVFGGRAKAADVVDFTSFDHMEANAFPGRAILTPENPLAGIDTLADQIKANGVTRVGGDIVVDDRLWPAGQQLSGITLDPMMINENVVDLTLTGRTAGRPAQFSYRPRISTQSVTSTVTTTAAGTSPALTISQDTEDAITITGTVPADAKPVVQVAEIADPSSFARSALIDALRARGVTVSARADESNPTRLLPAKDGYRTAQRVAAFVSPPFAQYEKLILKVSHNRGADTNMCLLALQHASTSCADGLLAVQSFLSGHDVPTDQFSFADGRGGEPADLTTPLAALDLLTAIGRRPDAQRFISCLPVLGRDGTIGDDEKSSPAAGHVYAKTGTVAAGDVAGARLTLLAETLVGYIDTASGHRVEFALYVTNSLLTHPDDLFGVFADLDHIAALLYTEV